MNKLQEIIDEMKADFLSAKENIDKNSDGGYYGMAAKNIAEVGVLKKYIPKLELLLKEQPEAITDDAHFCKHSVVQSDACASSSETAVVVQNENIQNDCTTCRHNNPDSVVITYRCRGCSLDPKGWSLWEGVQSE